MGDDVVRGDTTTSDLEARAWVYWSDNTVTSREVSIPRTWGPGSTESAADYSDHFHSVVHDAIEELIREGPEWSPPDAPRNTDPQLPPRDEPVWNGPPASEFPGHHRPRGAPPVDDADGDGGSGWLRP